jgi:hypothetical protein
VLWSTGTDGRRRWFHDGASWRMNDAGDVVEAWTPSGVPIAIPNWSHVAQLTASRIGRGIAQATDDPWLARAMLAIATHETKGHPLPILGDWRDAHGRQTLPGAPGSHPLSVGYYQFLDSTARGVGTTWQALATSPEANHHAALTLIARNAPKVGNDFLTLAAIWGAGGVRRRPENATWGVVSWRPSTLTEYAAAWNAARGLVEPAPARSSSSWPLAVAAAWFLFRFGGHKWITV